MILLLALLLAALGVADAARLPVSRPPSPTLSRLALPGASGLVVLVLGTWLLGFGWSGWWLVPLGLVVVSAWLFLSERASSSAPWWGLGTVVVAGLTVLAFGQHVDVGDGPLSRWYDSLELAALDDVAFDTFVLAAACLVFLYASANVIVRLVLSSTGSHVLASEDTMKGGRVLGPIERWFIFTMALGGQYAALAAIIAAKGVLRFPEISRDRDVGIKAEYVLVGSFVSWFLAFLFVPLLT